jgi:hypothetical protein
MFDYFDYIHESSQEDIDDIDVIYNEYEMTINEFDSYVQEGVGLKILVGAGIAAALGGLIALLIKLFSKKSENGVTKETKKALSIIEQAEKAGIKNAVLQEYPNKKYFKILEVSLLLTDNTADCLEDYLHYLGYPSEGKPKSLETIDVTNENITQSNLGIYYNKFCKDFIKLLSDNTDKNVDMSLENIKDVVKKIQEKESEFIGRARRLHNIQDKYKKLSKSYPENYAGNDEIFIDKIDRLHAIMSSTGSAEKGLLTMIEKDVSKAMHSNTTNVPEKFIDAVNNKNIRSIRIMMKNMLLFPPFKEFDEMDKIASSIPGLYDKHNGEELIEDKSKWNDKYVSQLMTKLISNFSHERVNHMKEVVKYLKS